MRRLVLPVLLAAAPITIPTTAPAASYSPPAPTQVPTQAPMRLPGADAGLCGHMVNPAVALKQLASGFGWRGRTFHPGLDLTAPYGSPIRAAADGVAIFAGQYYGYGNMVDIRHADGTVTRYAHMSAFAKGVRPGTAVQGGEVIGRVGTSGEAHGAHVHFEVRINGRPVDPKPFLALASCDGVPHPDPVEEARAPAGPAR